MTAADKGQAMSISSARAAFRKLHDSGCFVIPNPWDIGTARYLRHCGFKALATISAGAAFSMGLPDSDGAVTGLGVRRISVGNALARAAWGGFMRAAKEIATEGRFDAFANAAPMAEINGFFRDDLKRRAV